jgi:hypothetical protein
MAVGVEAGARKTAVRFDSATLSLSHCETMPEFSNFNSSGVGLSPTELPPVSQSAEHAEHPPTISDQPVSVALQQPNKRRRPSKSKMPGEIRRSSSTPHMRNLALAHSGELSPTTDKRRNKLGYHRTSVACGKQAGRSALATKPN